MSEQSDFDESRAMLEQSFEDIKAGRTYPAEECMEAIAAELGLTLERRPASRDSGFNSGE